MTITELTRRMNISRGTYYNHIADPNLPFDLLERYGRMLNHDFTEDIPTMKKYSLEEPEVKYGNPSTIEEAIEQRDYWRERYYGLMEKYHRIIDKKM